MTAWRRATTKRSALSRATSSRPRRCAASPNARRVSLLALPLPPLPAVLRSARCIRRCRETRHQLRLFVLSFSPSVRGLATKLASPLLSRPSLRTRTRKHTHTHTRNTHTHPHPSTASSDDTREFRRELTRAGVAQSEYERERERERSLLTIK